MQLMFLIEYQKMQISKKRRKEIVFRVTSLFLFGLFVYLGPRLGHMEVSQARGPIRAAAASLHHSHSNSEYESHLQPTPSSWQ